MSEDRPETDEPGTVETDKSETVKREGSRQAKPDPRPNKTDGIKPFLHKIVLLALVVFGFIVAIRFYLAGSSFIDAWVAERYVDLFEAGFNLSLLLIVVAAVLMLINKDGSE
ncbi:MAG: hypothetical protein ABEK59_06515 [Halobacteria archaeon]